MTLVEMKRRNKAAGGTFFSRDHLKHDREMGITYRVKGNTITLVNPEFTWRKVYAINEQGQIRFLQYQDADGKIINHDGSW